MKPRPFSLVLDRNVGGHETRFKFADGKHVPGVRSVAIKCVAGEPTCVVVEIYSNCVDIEMIDGRNVRVVEPQTGGA
jgi:hypothetical protein